MPFDINKFSENFLEKNKELIVGICDSSKSLEIRLNALKYLEDTFKCFFALRCLYDVIADSSDKRASSAKTEAKESSPLDPSFLAFEKIYSTFVDDACEPALRATAAHLIFCHCTEFFPQKKG